MRKVRCRITGECGYDYEFYKAPNRKYYKNKEIYDNAILQQEYRDKIVSFINSNILNKNVNNCVSLIRKLILETGLNTKFIYESIVAKFDYIKKLIDGMNESDTSKIYIIFSIITKFLNKVTYAGCYEIRNNETNEVYIGESIDLFNRFTVHISELYENKHHCKRLQEAFNKTKSILNFTITPLFMLPIASMDKNELKQETLYLESAFYIIYKSNHEELYNTLNPYMALKKNLVSLDTYEIDCKKSLQLLANDKYNVLPNKLLKIIRKNLQEDQILNIENINTTTKINTLQKENNIGEPVNEISYSENIKTKNIEGCIEYTKKLLKNNVKLYRITNLLDELANEGILPVDYNYAKIREILVNNNLIIIDEFRNTVATDYALINGFYFIGGVRKRNNVSVFTYYVSEKLRELLIDAIFRYDNINDLRRIS